MSPKDAGFVLPNMRRCCGILVGNSRCDFPSERNDYETTNKRNNDLYVSRR